MRLCMSFATFETQRYPFKHRRAPQAYDLVAGTSTLVVSKYMPPTECLGRFPTLAPEVDQRRLKGAVREQWAGYPWVGTQGCM